MKNGSVILAACGYNGVGHVVATNLSEADVMWKMHGASSSSFPDLDQFNRVTSSRWTKDLAGGDVDFFDLDITYDRNSNITLVEDNIYGGVDVAYTIDNLNRLVKAKEGTWTPGTGITSMTREQLWQSSGGGGANMLDQLGNWEHARLDLNGNGNFGDTVGAVVEYDDDRTHNTVNELTGRDTDDNGTDNYTLVYDKVGNLTDDGQSYTYVYDAFGRLRKIKNRSNAALVEEFWYDGSNRRVAWKSDSEPDGDVDASDKTYYVAHDERWRIVAVYRESDTSPKEEFVYHNAGASGYGGSSYIDDCILRDRDHNSGWTSAADGTLEQRRYYCQNWRHDVVALIKSDGKIAERDRYLSYGTPFGSPLADATFDGTVSASDTTQVNTDWGANYHVRSDFNLDGAVGAADSAEVTANSGKTLGWGTLSDMTNVANRKGYAGYELDIAIGKLYHVRYRVLHTEIGRWLARDPLVRETLFLTVLLNETVNRQWRRGATDEFCTDGPSSYWYGLSSPLYGSDPQGLLWIPYPVPLPDCVLTSALLPVIPGPGRIPLPNPMCACCLSCPAWVCPAPGPLGPPGGGGWMPAPTVGPTAGLCLCTAGWCVTCTRGGCGWVGTFLGCTTGTCNNCAGACTWLEPIPKPGFSSIEWLRSSKLSEKTQINTRSFSDFQRFWDRF